MSDLPMASLLLERDWIDAAACRGMPTDLFYPERGESIERPMAVCASCPVKAECRDEADQIEELWLDVKGVRGGESARQRMLRRGMRRERER